MRATLEERVVFHFVRRGFHHDRRLRVVFRVNTRDAVDRKDIIFVASFFVHQNVRRGKYNASAVVRKPQFRGFDDRNYIVTALDIIERSRSMSEHGCRRPRIRHDTDFRCIRAGRRNLRAQQWIVLRISHGRDDTTKQLFDEIFAHFLAHQLAGIDADVLNRDVVDTSTPGDKTRIVDVQFQIRPRLVGIGRVAAAGFRRDLIPNGTRQRGNWKRTFEPSKFAIYALVAFGVVRIVNVHVSGVGTSSYLGVPVRARLAAGSHMEKIKL